MDIHDRSIPLSDFIKCDKCSHKDVCVVKKDIAGEKIIIHSELYDDCPFNIHIDCKYFQERLSHSKTLFWPEEKQKKAIDPALDQMGTGIEYLDNQPICKVTSDQSNTADIRCEECMFSNFPADRVPCWACHDRSMFVSKK